nr:hypothetical protein [Tanacetum cinerariifolium]
MIAILEKYEHNQDFHQIVDFVEASHIRIETMEEGTKILITVDGKLRTISESSIRRNLKLNDEAGIRAVFPSVEVSHPYHYALSKCLKMGQFGQIPHTQTYVGEGSGTPTESHHTPTSMASQSLQHELPSPHFHLHYIRRARIAQSSALPHVEDKPASPIGDDSQGEACPTDSGLAADQDRGNIAKTSTLPSESTPRVTSFAAGEGSMQQKLNELTALYTSLQRQQSEMISKFALQELEINRLKARIKLLEDKDRGVAAHSGDDAPIKGRSLDEGEEAAERVSDDTEEMETVLTSMDAAKSTPYTRRKGKEKIVKSDTPKKKKLQEQIDVQVVRELEEQMAREDQRMSEQIARDVEVARIHAEEELQMMINSLDRSNEIVVKYL